jgi:hypothetical protein
LRIERRKRQARVKLLLTKEFSQESKDVALLYGCYQGNAEIVKLLLVNSADPTRMISGPKSAIQYAASFRWNASLYMARP